MKFDEMKFELTDNHIKLLSKMYVDFDDYTYDGAPVVDTKRPYGNSSVIYDLYEILFEKEWDSNDDIPDELYDELMKTHRETGTALQIVLITKSFEPGIYEKSNRYDSRSWRKVE